jgi:hypothetical protein
MQQRGRKSSAALSVVAGSIDGRTKAPDDLTKGQADIWERTVANEAADFFRTAALQRMLADYCRHRETADHLTSIIDGWTVLKSTRADDEEKLSLEDMDRLMKMRERETRAAADKATKLRLTNQARYTPQAAATAAKKASERKLWDRVA